VFALQVCVHALGVIKLNYIMGEIVGCTWNEAQRIREMVGHLRSASDTGEENAAGDTC
jgi:hypothetical protein